MQIIIQHALIMAAGRGNRMRPLTDTLPKPMIQYNGDTLIGSSLNMLSQLVPYIHVTVGYKKALLSEYLMTRGGVNSILNTEGHGNAWWLQNTLMRYLDEPVLVLTTDNITILDIDFLAQEYLRLGSPDCMLVPVKVVPGIEGDYIESEDGIVKNLDRKQPRDTYCSGIQVLNPKKINDSFDGLADDFYLIWRMLISIQQLKVSNVYPQKWFSIDTLEQILGIHADQ